MYVVTILEILLPFLFVLAVVVGASTLRLRKGSANGVTRRRFAYDLEVTKNKKHILAAYVCFDIFALLLGIYVLLIVKPGWALIIVALFFVYYVYSVYKGQIALIKEVLSSSEAGRQTSENR
jgi:hypothetical protein